MFPGGIQYDWWPKSTFCLSEWKKNELRISWNTCWFIHIDIISISSNIKFFRYTFCRQCWPLLVHIRLILPLTLTTRWETRCDCTTDAILSSFLTNVSSLLTFRISLKTHHSLWLYLSPTDTTTPIRLPLNPDSAVMPLSMAMPGILAP